MFGGLNREIEKFQLCTFRKNKIMNIFSTSETLIEALKKSEKNEIIDNYRKLLKENNEIPKFFISHSNSEKEYKNSFFANMMINLANQQSFHAILENYPSKDDVQFLRNAYEEMAKNSHVRVMRYTTYKQLRQKWPEKFQPILSSKLFVEIGGHSMHTINVDELFKHLDMIPRCVTHYLRLNQYDYLKTGSIDEESFKKCSELCCSTKSKFHIAINISDIQLREEGFISFVSEMLEKYNIPPEYIEFEITEGVIMQSVVKNIELLIELKRLGVSIALDDFGTGYSSLSYLKRLPIDVLKIDKSFVDGIGVDEKSEYIAESIIKLSHSLNLRVVAEGVETKEQLGYLNKMKCDVAQGYYFSKPEKFEVIKEMI